MMKKTILFQGDSITDCGRVSGAGGGMGCGYPAMILARLMCDVPETEWRFFNRGISGNRIVDLYARWRVDCLNLEPDILSVLVGVNDTWHEENKNGVDVPRYERFYRELLEWTLATRPSVRLVLMEPFLCVHNEKLASMFEDVRQRAAVVKSLAKEFDAVFIPLQSIFDAASECVPIAYWAAEGVHPTPAGHQLIADAWLEFSPWRG